MLYSASKPAIAAVLQVTRIPVIRADGESLTMRADLFGAMALKIPMLIPIELMLPNPQSMKLEIKFALGDKKGLSG